jgi:phosphatidylglycerophosphatase A
LARAASAPSAPRRPAELVALAVASGLGAGYAPWAPGTAGSAVGLLLFWPLSQVPWPWQAGALVVVTLAGVLAGSRTAAHLGLEDPGLVVVDEVAGLWVTLLFVPFTPLTAALGFLAFRLMDIVKPFPARRLEDLPGGWGIMADDLMAGVYANVLVRAVVHFL